MVLDAEEKGLLKPGGTIVEGTSGNTGIGLAMVAAQRGYRCIFTMADKMSKEKIDLLRAMGAEVHVCPTAVEKEDPRSYYEVAADWQENTWSLVSRPILARGESIDSLPLNRTGDLGADSGKDNPLRSHYGNWWDDFWHI